MTLADSPCLVSKALKVLTTTLYVILVIFPGYKSANAQPSLRTDTPASEQLKTPDAHLLNTLSLVKVTSRLDRITALVSLPTNPQEVLIVQGSGVIDLLSQGRIRRKNFLDIEDLVSETNPDALFGITFPRYYPATRFGYLGYVDRQGDTVISRVTVGEDTRVSEESLRVEMKIVQISQHQRTGALTFGDDDALYIATGDGGYDPPAESSAQNTQSLLGKILRINVGNDEYTVPQNNPYQKINEFLPEIFAIGLRDPFQILMDKNLYVLDRGKTLADEINLVQAQSNYGWPWIEGESEPAQPIPASSVIARPVIIYQRSNDRCLGASTILERKERRFLVYGDCKSGALYAQELREGLPSPPIIEIGSCHQPVSAMLIDPNGDLLIGTQLGEVYLATGIFR
jgi:glucose/arabinose dehydrogenase